MRDQTETYLLSLPAANQEAHNKVGLGTKGQNMFGITTTHGRHSKAMFGVSFRRLMLHLAAKEICHFRARCCNKGQNIQAMFRRLAHQALSAFLHAATPTTLAAQQPTGTCKATRVGSTTVTVNAWPSFGHQLLLAEAV